MVEKFNHGKTTGFFVVPNYLVVDIRVVVVAFQAPELCWARTLPWLLQTRLIKPLPKQSTHSRSSGWIRYDVVRLLRPRHQASARIYTLMDQAWWKCVARTYCLKTVAQRSIPKLLGALAWPAKAIVRRSALFDTVRLEVTKGRLNGMMPA